MNTQRHEKKRHRAFCNAMRLIQHRDGPQSRKYYYWIGVAMKWASKIRKIKRAHDLYCSQSSYVATPVVEALAEFRDFQYASRSAKLWDASSLVASLPPGEPAEYPHVSVVHDELRTPEGS